MRSRDGNNYSSLAVCSVILLNSLVLNASEYLVSYRYTVKDLVIYNESLQVSRAMKKCAGEPKEYLELVIDDENELDEIIENNPAEFIDFIQKTGIDIEHKEITKNAQNSSTTILTLKTKCFKVDINQNLAKITSLK